MNEDKEMYVIEEKNLREVVEVLLEPLEEGYGYVEERFVQNQINRWKEIFKDHRDEENKYWLTISDFEDFVEACQIDLIDFSLNSLMKSGEIEPLVDKNGEIRYRLTEKGTQRAKDILGR